MSTTPDHNNHSPLDAGTVMQAWSIGDEVKKIFAEAADRVLNATLSPEMARIATCGEYDCTTQMKKLEQDALDAAAAGKGPMPYDRDWYNNGYEIQDLVNSFWNWELSWHLANDFDEVLIWALKSAEGQRALELKDDPNNPRQHPLRLLLDFRKALSAYRRDLLAEHAEKLEWSHDFIYKDPGD